MFPRFRVEATSYTVTSAADAGAGTLTLSNVTLYAVAVFAVVLGITGGWWLWRKPR